MFLIPPIVRNKTLIHNIFSLNAARCEEIIIFYFLSNKFDHFFWSDLEEIVFLGTPENKDTETNWNIIMCIVAFDCVSRYYILRCFGAQKLMHLVMMLFNDLQKVSWSLKLFLINFH